MVGLFLAHRSLYSIKSKFSFLKTEFDIFQLQAPGNPDVPYYYVGMYVGRYISASMPAVGTRRTASSFTGHASLPPLIRPAPREGLCASLLSRVCRKGGIDARCAVLSLFFGGLKSPFREAARLPLNTYFNPLVPGVQNIKSANLSSFVF